MARTWTAILLVALLGACSGCHGSARSTAPGPDASLDAAPLVCPPAPLDEWVTPPYRHAQPVQRACTAALIEDFYASCLGSSASADSCAQSWGAAEDAAHALCRACLITPVTGATLGPLIDYGNGDGQGTVSVNVAGCLELLDPSQPACAAAVQQADECQHEACDATCPVEDAASFANWQACVGAAAQSTCAPYLAGATCVNAEDAGSPPSCATGADFQTEFMDIAGVFCL